MVRDIVTIYDNYDFATEVLVASCRHPMHVVEAEGENLVQALRPGADATGDDDHATVGP